MLKEKNTKTSLNESFVTTTVFRIGRKYSIRISKRSTHSIAVIAITVLAIILLFPYSSSVQIFDLPKEGEVAEETIIAPFTFDVVKSKEALEKGRQEARDQVLAVFNYDSKVQTVVRNKFLKLRKILKYVNDTTVSDTSIISSISKLKKELSENTVKILASRPYLLDDALFQAERILERGVLSVLLVPTQEKLAELRDMYNAPFESFLIYKKRFITLRRDSTEQTVKLTEIPVKEIALENVISTLKVERMFDQEALTSLYEILFAYVKPNVTMDGKETSIRESQAAKSVLRIEGKVIKDTEIVRKHQEVTADIVQKLKSLRASYDDRYGRGEKQRILLVNLGKVILVIIPLFFVALYIKLFHKDILSNNKHVSALATLMILQIVIIRLSLLIVPRLFEGNTEISSLIPEYLIPTSVAAMLASILFGLRISLLSSVYTAIFFGVVLGFNHAMFLYSLLGGVVTGLVAQNLRYRWDFFKAMPPVIASYLIFISLWHLISYNATVADIIQNVSLGVINCITVTFLSMMSVPIFESLFDITTSMTLVEFSDMNHPLLKRLSIEAPGTYNHSVLVANLAESAAERIHANALYARVASYYHDVGKIKKPHYFIENQQMDKNVHGKLTPSMSALVISTHVKDGLELAKEYKLPTSLQSAIAQHHGTSRVSFFYQKALEQDPHKQVQEKDFSYPGPRPQNRENAIIMLADSIEAASRSLATSSPKLLRELVKKIIHDKFALSQLDECNLTFKDLDEIIQGFMPILQGIFHTRIEYPSTSATGTVSVVSNNKK